MEISFKRSHACTVILTATNPAAGHHQPTPPLETPGHSQASLGQSLMESLLLFLGPGAHKFLCVLQESISQSGDLAKGLRTPREFDFKGQWDLIAELPWDWGNKSLGEHKPNFVHIKTQGEGAVIPQETEPDLPVSVQEFPMEAWIGNGPAAGSGY